MKSVEFQRTLYIRTIAKKYNDYEYNHYKPNNIVEIKNQFGGYALLYPPYKSLILLNVTK
jgi:hypothetical protein